MRPRSLIVLITVSTFLLMPLASCGGTDVGVGGPNQDQNGTTNDDNDPNQSNDDEDNFEEEASELATNHCDRIFECCTEEERHFEDQSECEEASVGQLFGLTDDELDGAIDAGAISVDEAAIDTCLETIAGLSCPEFDGTRTQRQRLEGCRDIISPQLHVGDDCDRDWACTDSICQDGTCEALPGGGEECEAMSCADGYYCDISQECVPQKDSGEECGDDDECLSGHCIGDNSDDQECHEVAPRCDG